MLVETLAFTCSLDPSAPPSNVSATAISSTEIRVHWNEVNDVDRNGIIIHYEVEYIQTTFGDATRNDTLSVDSLTFVVNITELEEYVEYFVRVRAYTSVGAGPYSYAWVERTEEDGNYSMTHYTTQYSFLFFLTCSPCLSSIQCESY